MGTNDFKMKYFEQIQQDLVKNYSIQKKSPYITSISTLISFYDQNNNNSMDITTSTRLTNGSGYHHAFYKQMIEDINKISIKGHDTITSVAEAFHKFMSIVRVKGLNPEKVFFRGQSN